MDERTPNRFRALVERRVPWKFVVAYALFIAMVAGIGYSRVAPHDWQLQSGRDKAFQLAIAAHHEGGPPLSQRCTSTKPDRIILKPAKWCPAGISDDQGMYLFLPVAADVLNDDNPKHALRTTYIVLSAIAAFVWPLTFYALFGTLAAFLSPLLLVFAQRSLQSPDIYFVGGSAVLILIPLALVAVRARMRVAVPTLAALVVCASAATAVRNHAGLPVLLAVLILLATKRDVRVGGRVAAGVLMLVAYLSISPFFMNAMRGIRDDNAQYAKTSDIARSHVFWHPIYLGLGYLPNDHNIYWLDTIGANKALSIDPTAVYPSHRYEQTIKKVVKDLVKDDPGFVVWMDVRKAAVALGQVGLALALLSVALALLVGVRGPRALLERPLLAVYPALPIGIAQALVGIPSVEYEQTWRAAAWLLFAFVAALLLQHLRMPRLTWRVFAVAGAGIAVAAALMVISNSLQDQAADWLAQGVRQLQR